MVENTLAIHEAAHAVAFLACARAVDAAIIFDDNTGQTIPLKEYKLSLSDAIITLAGPMGEQIALEKGLIIEMISPPPGSAFHHAPVAQAVDDESKYRAYIYELQSKRPGGRRAAIHKITMAETRMLVERHWSAIIEVAHAFEAISWERDAFRPKRKYKSLVGEEVKRIFKRTPMDAKAMTNG